MSDKTNPSDLYDEEFLKKKEEFYSKMEDINASAPEVQEDDGSFEELIDDARNILEYVDVLVDGAFIEEKKNLRLQFRGSENQRLIDVKKTLECGNVVTIE